MNFHVMTLFPEMILSAMNHSIIKRGQEAGLVNLNCVDIRDFSGNKHRQVDDYPYGGGVGMVMKPQPIYDAYLFIKKNLQTDAPVIFMSPQGKPFTQSRAVQLSALDEIVILCGHYEGIDQRIIDEIVTEEISIGDYVLTGGELAAMVVIDAVSRLIPGVLSKPEATQDESFSTNLLEYPQYTRPPEFLNRKVPDILLTGHHENINKWRAEQAYLITQQKRPDLLET